MMTVESEVKRVWGVYYRIWTTTTCVSGTRTTTHALMDSFFDSPHQRKVVGAQNFSRLLFPFSGGGKLGKTLVYQRLRLKRSFLRLRIQGSAGRFPVGRPQ